MSNETASQMRPATGLPGADTPSIARSLDSLPACVHHWLLSEPVCGVISGRCKRCGGERDFPATPEGTERFDDYRELTQARPTRPVAERLAH